MKMKLMNAIFAALCVSAVSASAATVTFDLTGNGGLADEHDFTDAATGLTLQIGANAIAHGALRDARVGQSDAGVGVKSYRNDSWATDSYNTRDILTFGFSDEVSIAAIEFSEYSNPNGNSSFRVVADVDGSNSLTEADRAAGRTKKMVSDYNGTNAGITDLVSFFGLAAQDDWARWMISSITVEYGAAAAQVQSLRSAPLTPVPLPAGGLLLLSGLAGIAYAGRRKARR